MTLAVRAVFWVIAYLGAVLSPLVFAAIGGSQPDHDFLTNFSVALGFVGLAMMGLEFVLVARFKPLGAPPRRGPEHRSFQPPLKQCFCRTGIPARSRSSEPL